MQVLADQAAAPTAIQTDLRAIFVSLELSRSTWLITSLSPSGGEKMSKHSVPAGDIAGLLRRLLSSRRKRERGRGETFRYRHSGDRPRRLLDPPDARSPKGSRATWLTPRRS